MSTSLPGPIPGAIKRAAGSGVGGTWVCVWACTAEWGWWCRRSGCGHRRGGDVGAGDASGWG
jgi:hypothetical protein